MEQNSNSTDVGIEHESDVPADADVYAYADDGEHAYIWSVDRTDNYEVRVAGWCAEAGLIERDGGYGVKYFDVDPDMHTDEWAERYAKNHQESIELARKHFN